MSNTQLATIPTEDFPRPRHRRHRAFCTQVALGMEPCKAYKRYVGKQASARTAYEQSCRLLARWRDYVGSLRLKFRDSVEQAGIKSKIALLQWHTRAVDTPVGLVDEFSDLAQEVTTITNADGSEIKKVKMVSKSESAAAIAKLAGFDAPQQIQVNHALTESPALSLLQDRLMPTKPIQFRDNSTAIEAELVPDHKPESSTEQHSTSTESKTKLDTDKAGTGTEAGTKAEAGTGQKCIDARADSILPTPDWLEPDQLQA